MKSIYSLFFLIQSGAYRPVEALSHFIFRQQL